MEPPQVANQSASYYRARYHDPTAGRFISEDFLRFPDVLFAKTPARREINNIAAAISPPFCYKS
jgi:hypothetical protein